MAILIFGAGLRLQLNNQTIYHFWFTIKLLLAKSIMFSFVECIIFLIFLLPLRKPYLLALQNEWRRIVLPIPVEGWIQGMLIQGWWAERHMHFTRKIGWVINCLKWNQMVWALLFTLGWLSTHSINIMHLHPIKIQSNKINPFSNPYHHHHQPNTHNHHQITSLSHHFSAVGLYSPNFEAYKSDHKVPFAMKKRRKFDKELTSEQNLAVIPVAGLELKIHSRELMFLKNVAFAIFYCIFLSM